MQLWFPHLAAMNWFEVVIPLALGVIGITALIRVDDAADRRNVLTLRATRGKIDQ